MEEIKWKGSYNKQISPILVLSFLVAKVKKVTEWNYIFICSKRNEKDRPYRRNTE